MGVEAGDKSPDESGLVESLLTFSGWFDDGKCGYHEVGLLGGQQLSRIDWCRWWLLFSKRNLS
jgi:hypothetical protein